MIIKVLAVATLVVVISGCQQIGQITAPLDYSAGVNVSSAQMTTFTDKKSTKNDVLDNLGQPGNKSEVAGHEIWSYGYSFVPGMPFTGKKNLSETTVFEFDKRGVLVRHYKTAATAQSGNALLNAAGM